MTAKIYADDLSDWNNAFNHLNIALELAGTLHSDDLYAASFYRSGQIRFAQRNFHLAKSDLDHAVQFAKKANPHLKGAVFAAAGLAHASLDADGAGRKYAQVLMEEAGKYTTNNNQFGGSAIEYIIKFNNGKYLAEKADALIMLGRPGAALHILDDAEEGTHPSETRRLAYIDILRAEAYMNLKAPQLDTATDLLASAFETSTSIKSEYNIGYITRLYNNLYRGPYAKSTKVADLGLSLRDWRKKLL